MYGFIRSLSHFHDLYFIRHRCLKRSFSFYILGQRLQKNRAAQGLWETGKGSLKFTERLKTGKFSEVWTGTWNNRTNVVIKVPATKSISAAEFLKEAEIMKRLEHKHLLQVCSYNVD